MFIDDATIKVKAGDGGDGNVSFNRNMMSLGPSGGSGGNGGNVYAEGIADLNALSQFRNKKEIIAENGEHGKPQFNDGANGKDHITKVPVGTVVHNLTTGEDSEIVKIGEQVILAKGGHGGKGNFHFRSPKNTSPKRFQEGLVGETAEIRLELKLIADVGFVGLPNVGKSSLLNELTEAKSKVANYPFTTLEPNLGAYYELILADIPGLIEGAHQGKGLGIKFLSHIERTKIIFHFIASDSKDSAKDYKVVKNELGKYNKALLEKPEYLFLTKCDAVLPEELKEKIALLKKINKNVLPISILIPETIKEVEKILNKIEKEK